MPTSDLAIHDNPTAKGRYAVGIKPQGGIDMVDLAKKLNEATKLQAKPKLDKISESSLKLTALSNLRTDLDSFHRANERLVNYIGPQAKDNIFNDIKARMSPIGGQAAEQYLTVSASNNNQDLIGFNFSARIHTLAKTDKKVSTPIDGWNSALGHAGTLTLGSVSSPPGTDIPIAATDSLAQVITKINQNTSLTGIKAYKFHQTPTSDPILVLQGSEVADPITLTISSVDLQDALGLTSFSPTPQNTLMSHITVDGVDFYRPSNTITDIYDGVTLSLKAPTGADTTSVTLDMDKEAILTSIGEWIDTFNAVKTTLAKHKNKQEGDEVTATNALYNDKVLKEVGTALNEIARNVVGVFSYWDEQKGFDPTHKNDVNNIKGIGFELINERDPASLLKFDVGTLQTRVDQDPKKILSLFGFVYQPTLSTLKLKEIPSYLPEHFTNQEITFQIQNYDALNNTYDVKLQAGDASETLTGISLTQTRPRLKFQNTFKDFVLQFDTPVTGNMSTTFRLTQGVAAKLNHKLTNILKNPIDVARFEGQKHGQLSAPNQTGLLGLRESDIIQRKRKEQDTVYQINQRADAEYERTIKQMNQQQRMIQNVQSLQFLLKQMNDPD